MTARLVLLLALVCAALAQNCVLTVPANPLQATGLALPYFQTGCAQADMPSFVDGAVFNPATGEIQVYWPLVIDAGTLPGCPITNPNLPLNAVVGLWFGTNGNTLMLMDDGKGSLAAGRCVNGFTDPNTALFTLFGQFAYCNAVVFFDVVKASVLVNPPALGIAADGLPCPTTRDFFIVDMDPNDNVPTVYMLLNNGLVCQNTSFNFMMNAKNVAMGLTNGSDERLIGGVSTALGGTCVLWKGIDLAEQGNFAGITKVASLALNEVFAEKNQKAPIALVPLNDPMTRAGINQNQPSLPKTNAYRAGVGQKQALTLLDADSRAFCFNYYLVQPIRLLKNTGTLVNFPSPDPAAGNSLFTFLAQRFFNSFGPNGLACADLLQIPQPGPVTVTLDAGGVAIAALIIPPNNGGAANTAAFTAALINAAPAAPALAWSVTQIVAALLLLSGLIV